MMEKIKLDKSNKQDIRLTNNKIICNEHMGGYKLEMYVCKVTDLANMLATIMFGSIEFMLKNSNATMKDVRDMFDDVSKATWEAVEQRIASGEGMMGEFDDPSDNRVVDFSKYVGKATKEALRRQAQADTALAVALAVKPTDEIQH